MSYTQLSRLIRSRTGIEVPTPAPQFERAIEQRQRELNCTGLEGYIKLLKNRPVADPEWTFVVQNATNRLTHFMRDEEQLRAMMALAADAQALHGDNQLKLWSAGCSTGEEPYTLAILGLESGLNVRVLGTDVNPQALEVARRGRFASWTLRRVPLELQQRHFDEVDAGVYSVKSHVRERVSFRVNNLVAEQPPEPFGGAMYWHVISCRNVLIYYGDTSVRKVLEKLASNMGPWSCLVLGASETVAQRRLPLRPYSAFGRIVYVSAATVSDQSSVSTLDTLQDLSDAGFRASVPASLRAPLESTHSPEASYAARDEVAAPVEQQAYAGLPRSYLQIQDALLRCLEENHTAAVFDALRAVVESNPSDSHARLSLGHMHLRQHEFEAAKLQYEAALDLDDAVAEAHFFLGLLLRKTRDLGAALAAFRRAVFLEPSFWMGSYLLAATAKRLGQTELSLSEFNRTRELLQSGEGSLPFVTHPLFHTQFVDSPDVVLQATLEELNPGAI